MEIIKRKIDIFSSALGIDFSSLNWILQFDNAKPMVLFCL